MQYSKNNTHFYLSIKTVSGKTCYQFVISDHTALQWRLYYTFLNFCNTSTVLNDFLTLLPT